MEMKNMEITKHVKKIVSFFRYRALRHFTE